MFRSTGVVLTLILGVLAACEAQPEGVSAPNPPDTRSSPQVASQTPTPTPSTSPVDKWVSERPSWLGERVLPLGSSGFGEVRPTPPILRNRRFATIDLFPPPEATRFKAAIEPVPPRVATRSSWRTECPVTLDQLSYVTMPFWGFDRQLHTGEMIVNAAIATDVVEVFRQMFRIRFPIEEMRVVTAKEVKRWETKPTGDVNVTSSFECRDAAESTRWSQHAYGLAIDVNPFHNPYSRGDLVAPELASAYVDRTWARRGMIFEGDQVTAAFDAIGWGWGGRWNSLKDWMHFSQNGH